MLVIPYIPVALHIYKFECEKVLAVCVQCARGRLHGDDCLAECYRQNPL